MRRTVNRIALAAVGLVLLLLGAVELAGAADGTRRVLPSGMPGWWRWTHPGDPVLTAAQRQQWTGQSWWWPVFIAALAVLVLLAAWWLIAQFRGHGLLWLRLDAPGAGSEEPTRLRAAALAGAVGREAAAVPGVSAARVRLRGKPDRPRADLVLRLAGDAEPTRVLAELEERTVADAARSAGLDALPATVRMRRASAPRGRGLA